MKKNKKIKLTSANEAKKRMKNSINFLNKSEFVKVDKSEDRILSENIISNFNIPEEDNSAVDGYAFNIKNNEKINIMQIIGSIIMIFSIYTLSKIKT